MINFIKFGDLGSVHKPWGGGGGQCRGRACEVERVWKTWRGWGKARLGQGEVGIPKLTPPKKIQNPTQSLNPPHHEIKFFGRNLIAQNEFILIV